MPTGEDGLAVEIVELLPRQGPTHVTTPSKLDQLIQAWLVAPGEVGAVVMLNAKAEEHNQGPIIVDTTKNKIVTIMILATQVVVTQMTLPIMFGLHVTVLAMVLLANTYVILRPNLELVMSTQLHVHQIHRQSVQP